ncbi:hypothetical protein GCM10010174_88890 [Kutzneria viridogrisea]|uniref:Uncharacterized protein n=1 Tax=Kutzneria viridogrisea TaxID=47990 RepID=A0ABR6BIU1_9PSEU|nr:hypothetical protein [Kutzneria viridogrisea]
MSPRTLAVLAWSLLATGVLALAAGGVVELTAISRTVDTPLGPAVINCGTPWPPGHISALRWHPEVLAALQSYPVEMREIAANAWDADCTTVVGLSGSLGITVLVFGLVLVVGGGVLLMVRTQRKPPNL